MDKILVEVSIPAIGKSYDVFLPGKISVSQACELLKDVFLQLSGEEFGVAGEMMLCERETGLIYNADDLVEKTKIASGSKLLLI